MKDLCDPFSSDHVIGIEGDEDCAMRAEGELQYPSPSDESLPPEELVASALKIMNGDEST